MEKNLIEKATKVISFISLVIVSLGAIKLVIFYRQYGINIGQFLNMQDILALYLNDLLYVILFGAIFYIYYVIANITNPDIRRSNIEEIFNIESFKLRFKKELSKFRKKMLVFSTVLIIFVWGIYFSLFDYTFSFLNILPILILLLNFFPIIQIEASRLFIKKFDREKFNFISVFISFMLIFTVLYIHNIIYEIKSTNNFKYYGTELKTKEKIYKSDSTINYIGKTKEFYFFYNISERNSIIVPSNQVTEVRLKDKYNIFYDVIIKN